jgi:hypothetical protein
MGQTFNINKIIEHYKLDVNEVAEALFPHARYKTLALRRVLKGEAFLDSQQIEKLANLIGVLIQDLFAFDDWKGRTEDGCLIMIKGEYKVKLNYNNTYMTLTRGSQVIAQEIVSPVNISLEDFISHINSLIKTN